MFSHAKHKDDRIEPMALFVRQDEEQSRLRTKVSSEMRQRMSAQSDIEPDDVSKDSHLMQDQHTTSKSGLIIGILAVVAVLFILWMFRP